MLKQQHFIEVKRTAEYYSIQPRNVEVAKVLFVLHGYSQLPEFFIEHFRNLPDLGILVVAPSGLSLSYQSGFYGRVGASWMTKHNRENEIKDYLAYLDQLYLEIKSNYPKVESFSVLGFSQGTATASRWYAYSERKMDRLICIAGALAADLDIELLNNKQGQRKLALFVGDKDAYINKDKAENLLKEMESNGVGFELIPYDGGHEIPQKELLTYFEKLIG